MQMLKSSQSSFTVGYLLLAVNWPVLSEHPLVSQYLKGIFFKLGFTPCKAEQPVQGMELQEKETQKNKHTGNLFKKNLQFKDVC